MAGGNQQWVLASYPDGMPQTDNWSLVEADVPAPPEGGVMARAIYLSVDPYMRGRISPGKNYAQSVGIGEVMHGGGVGEVLESRHPSLRPGDIVESFGFGWQQFAGLEGEGLTRVDPGLAPIRYALSVLGLTGLTAYFTLTDMGRLQPGETVVVSAASGAVGQIAGQIAKIIGCRAVAVAGSDRKLAFCRESLGYDAGINHRTEEDLAAAIARTCPDGVDVYLDNTAGPIHDAVMQNLAIGARIIICGTVSLADRLGQPDIGPRFLRQILVARATMRGFLLFDYGDRYDEGRARLAEWLAAGRLEVREDVLQGIDRMPEAFLRLLKGENFGKQLVQVADDPTLT